MPTLVKPPEPLPMAPQPNVIEMLETTLAEARKGEIDGIVILLSHPDGDTSDRWALSSGFYWARLLGAAEAMKYKYLRRYEEGR